MKFLCDDSAYFARLARAHGRAGCMSMLLALVLLTGGGYLYALGSGWCIHVGALAILAVVLAIANMAHAWKYAGLSIRWKGYEIEREIQLNRGPIRIE